MTETLPEDASRNVISALRDRYDELTNSQKRIAETIVDDPQFVAFATVDKFAARLRVSASTIVRFAYRLGFSGYPELQEQVRSLVLENLNTTSTSTSELTVHLGDGVFAESLGHDLTLLQRTIERLHVDDLERAVDCIVQAKRVRIIGGVTAFSAAYYSAVTLERVRERIALLDGATPIGPIIEMEDGDVLLAFSFAPYARSTKHVIDAAKERGANVVVVTDSPISPFRGKADVLLLAAVAGIGTQNSYVAAFAIANAIVNGVAAKSPDALERYGATVQLLDRWDTYLLESNHGDA